MNYQMVDYLDKIIAQDFEGDTALFTKEGVLSPDGRIVLDKINLMTGAYASNLADGILEADMDLQEVVVHLERLQEQNQYMGIYYFLLYLFASLRMDIMFFNSFISIIKINVSLGPSLQRMLHNQRLKSL